MEYKVSICTLGCRVNQYESEVFRSELEKHGISVVPFSEKCDASIINTCAVTSESGRKSKQMIRRAVQNTGGKVVVCGCFSEIAPDDTESIKGVVYVTGNKDKDKIIAAVLGVLGINDALPEKKNLFPPCKEILTTPERVRTFIKIQDGCEHKCAYCIIPRSRGPVRSKSPEDVIDEAAALARAGSPEVILTGIEISEYGRDFKGESRIGLGDLITRVNDIPEVQRIALGSLDPTLFTPAFTERIITADKLIRHYHLSIQSGCTSTLRRMRRGYTAEKAMDTIHRIRASIPDATVSADIIVGFPGETDADFKECVDFCREADFLNLHIFPYSIRKGTEAAVMEGQIPEEIKRERAAALEEVHKTTLKDFMKRYAQRTTPVNVLFEREKDGILSGHTEHYVELFTPGDSLLVGKICRVIPDENGNGSLC